MEAPLDDELEWMAIQELVPQQEQEEDDNDYMNPVLSEDAKIDAEKDISICPPQFEECEKTMDEDGPSFHVSDAVAYPSFSKLPHRQAAAISGEYIPITGLSGERVYAELIRPTVEISQSFDIRKTKGMLLSQPIDAMLEQAHTQQYEKILNNLTGNHDVEVPSSEMHEKLWVDKYAPKSFAELLSDEHTNREVLGWLKQWDPCVYGTQRLSTSSEVLSALHCKTITTQANSASRRPFSKSFPAGSQSSVQEFRVKGSTTRTPTARKSYSSSNGSQHGRPDEKVLLLCGPPGLGKTTLAHVAANHCGYHVVEINASDDRIGATFQGKILDAVQMKSVMGNSKPNCLVIDEIDGAFGGAEGKGAINFLLEMIKDDTKAIDSNEEPTDDGTTKRPPKKKRRSTVQKLSRPIICICNDLYAPVLRSLRQVARVHTFATPSASRVVTRLQSICNLEGLKANPRALSALVEHTECDIRSCLNTLQFLHRKKEALKTLDVGSQVIGKKDKTSSMFSIWGEMFQKKKSKTCKNDKETLAYLYNLFSTHGDYELSMDGIHENLLHMHYHDASLEKTVGCLFLIGELDLVNKNLKSRQHYFLNAYQPAIFLAIRQLVGQIDRPNIEWPKSFQRYKQELSANKEMLASWFNGMLSVISRGLSSSWLVVDLLSPLLVILLPSLRPLALQLLSPRECDMVKNLVDIMIGYGISYKRTTMPSRLDHVGDFNGLLLNPPLHKLIEYKDYSCKYVQHPYTVRQMLSYEIEMERIKRESARIVKEPANALPVDNKLNSVSFANPVPNASKAPEGEKIEKTTNVEVVSTTKSELISTGTNIKPSVKVRPATSNFFGRFRKASHPTAVEVATDIGILQRDMRPLLFKFHEGFTNAIKKPVLMRDLL